MGKYSNLVTTKATPIANSFKNKKEYEMRIEEIDNGFLLRENWSEPKGKDDYTYESKITYYKTLDEIQTIIK